MNTKPPDEVSRLIAAFRYSAAGLKVAAVHPAFRIEAIATCVMTPLAFMIAGSGVELALLLGSLWLVMIVELLNTGIERTVDRVSADWHELSKQAKDIGSAAVLLSLANAATVWLAVMLY